ncbi:erythromycin esterase family protein [Halolamina salifodinae]|uniref:Erythromycin esterase n=1 Tax=Halolamina salifodinae TaxID=1202767 RepID=A0A8T4GWQ6_9EURY|nr:erythromycin esterase family protein [Halolamina salifodinae]MBP1987356.1 erythromycin esterase [Halolamina salifodinae]
MCPPPDRLAAISEHATLIPAAGSGVDDPPTHSLAPDEARIIGLGEATHGTRECFRHKARLIKTLVAEHGYRTVAFEADAAAATALDSFVRDFGSNAPASALADLEMWQWQTESVGKLLAWLRTFNDERSSSDRVRIRGVDLSTPSAPAAPLRPYFEAVDHRILDSEALRTVADATVPDGPHERAQALDAVAAAAETLTDHVAATRDNAETTSTPVSWETARHLCRVVEQACEWARVRHEQPGPHEAGMAARDRFMAENARWTLAQDAGAGVALWAHDGHVQRGTFDDGTPWADATTMGERLDRELGDDYRPVGFDFARGSFRAAGAGSGEVETFSVGTPIEESASATFAAVDGAPYLLDLRAAAVDGRLEPWLATERRTRYVGSVFDPKADAEEGYARTNLPASFDHLLFLPASTAARPIDGG